MTRREIMAERVLRAALAHVTEHGTDEYKGSFPMRWAKIGEYTIWLSSFNRERRLDIWDGPEMLYLATWSGDDEPQLHGFTSGAWMEELLGPMTDGRECFAAERLCNAFTAQWQRPPMSEAEALGWGSTLPDDQLQSYGFTDRVEFEKISAALIAFEEAEMTSTVLN